MSSSRPTYHELELKIENLENQIRLITDDKALMETAVKFEQNKNQILMDGLAFIGVGINIVDEDSRIIFQNDVLTGIFGEYDQKDCRFQYKGGEECCSICPFKRALHENQVVSRIIRAKNGHDYEIISAPLPEIVGHKKNAIGVFIDISSRKKSDNQRRKLEARLQRAEKLESIGILAGGVAHDLNNILAALVGYPDILLNELPADSPFSEPIRAMKDSGERAAAVVQDLLALSRQGFKHTTVLNLNNIINSYLSSLQFSRLSAAHRGITFNINLTPDLVHIVGSTVHLNKTLMNLVVNAVEAIPAAGTITISTYNIDLEQDRMGYENIPAGKYAVLQVRDSGNGIEPHDLERIFEPFYTKKSLNKSGTGLGLAVVWGTVKDHEGYLDLNSTFGEGTTFELYLPGTVKEPVLEQKSIGLMDLAGSGEKILVIDDIPEQRDIASKILSRLGYFVVTISGGAEGIEYLKKYSMDLVMIDMIMEPGMDGLDTYMEILKINPRQKAIIMSGYSETERVKQALSLGALHYIRKPYTVESLGKAIKKELEKDQA